RSSESRFTLTSVTRPGNEGAAHSGAGKPAASSAAQPTGGAPRCNRWMAAVWASTNAPTNPCGVPCLPMPAQAAAFTGRPTSSTSVQPAACESAPLSMPRTATTVIPGDTNNPSITGAEMGTVVLPTGTFTIAPIFSNCGPPANVAITPPTGA